MGFRKISEDRFGTFPVASRNEGFAWAAALKFGSAGSPQVR